MGQITEDILDGSCCALYGCYFEHPKKDKKGETIGIFVHGYSVACKDCFDKNCGYPKAKVDTF